MGCHSAVLVAVILSISGTSCSSDEPRTVKDDFFDSFLEFATTGFNIFQENSRPTDNLLFSPISLYNVLMITHLASEGNATKEICSALHLCKYNKTILHETFGDLNKNLIQDTALKGSLQMANGLFIQHGINVTFYFKRAISDLYNTAFTGVDFANDSEAAMLTVNKWVNNNTRGAIPAILQRNPSPQTKMMMVNAVHFKGQWKWKFDPLSTEPKGFFYISRHLRIQVPMMTNKVKTGFGHRKDIEASILELPYKQPRISMFFILPDNHDTKLNLDATKIKMLISSMRKQDVAIRIPRFTLDSSLNLNNLLWDLGIRNIFSPNEACLRAISENVYVSDMLQRALLQVDEEGSIASAATLSVIERIGHADEPYFEANRPFIFLVLDKKSGAVLFIGRMANF